MAETRLIFLENIEWFDESGRQIVQRVPAEGSAEIKWGAQLTVRESQAAVFFYKGKAVGAFGPGRHTLRTGNIPLLTKLLSVPWAFDSPLRAEIYFVNLKVFTNLKWGTRDPVAFRDAELGLVRLRAFGVFNLQVAQPVLLINRLVGTQGVFTTEEVEEYLNRVIVSRLNDYLGEKLDTLLNLPSRYDEISEGLAKRLEEDFGRFGIRLAALYVNAITPPPEVQQAIDDRSRVGAFQDLERLMQLKAAMAMEKAASAGEGAGSGMGTALGLMLPAMFSQFFAAGRPAAPGPGAAPPTAPGPGGTLPVAPGPGGAPPAAAVTCPECKSPTAADAKFCPQCGHQLVVFDRCARCGKNLTPAARFCPRCGLEVGNGPQKKFCPHCGAENLADAVHCNDCGEKL